MVEEDRVSNSVTITSVRHVAETLDQPTATFHKILRKILRYYPYKMSHTQKLLPWSYNIFNGIPCSLTDKPGLPLEHSMNRWNSVSSGWRNEYAQLPHLGIRRKSSFESSSSVAFSEGYGMVQVYCIIYVRFIFLGKINAGRYGDTLRNWRELCIATRK